MHFSLSYMVASILMVARVLLCVLVCFILSYMVASVLLVARVWCCYAFAKVLWVITRTLLCSCQGVAMLFIRYI